MTENVDAAASMNEGCPAESADLTPLEVQSESSVFEGISADPAYEGQAPSVADHQCGDGITTHRQAPVQDVAHGAKQGHASSHPLERRRRRRALISAPVRVRSLHVTLEATEEVSTTLDVSREGILVSTQLGSYEPGMEVAVTFPYNDHAGPHQVEQPGRVVRLVEMRDGRQAVAISYAKRQPQEDEPLFDSSGRKIGTTGQMRAITHPESRRPLVLAVDSDPRSREALSNFLSGEGYDAFVVPSGEEARAILELHTPALVIAEAEAKGSHGYDLCAFVKSSFRLRHIPVLMTTNSAYPTDYANAHALGATICMAKPYKQERLAHVVRLLAPPRATAAGTRTTVQPPVGALPRRGPAAAAEQKGRLPKFLKF